MNKMNKKCGILFFIFALPTTARSQPPSRETVLSTTCTKTEEIGLLRTAAANRTKQSFERALSDEGLVQALIPGTLHNTPSPESGRKLIEPKGKNLIIGPAYPFCSAVPEMRFVIDRRGGIYELIEMRRENVATVSFCGPCKQNREEAVGISGSKCLSTPKNDLRRMIYEMPKGMHFRGKKVISFEFSSVLVKGWEEAPVCK